MQSSLVMAGVGLAAVGFAGRYLFRRAPGMSQKFSEAIRSFPAESMASSSKYYRGGFDPKINKREASLILGVSPTASKGKVRSKFLKHFLLFFRFCGFFFTKTLDYIFGNFYLDQRRTQTDYAIESSRSGWIAVFSSKNQ